MVQVRLADKSEIEWINNCYDKVDFVHSVFDKEKIAIAELDGQKAGLGRLVSIDTTILELGGMYVQEEFRGKGISREIVHFLLKLVPPEATLYCIPFDYLTIFYKQCGFVLCSDTEQVPKELLDKYQWCKEKYTHSTSLLVLEK